MTGLEEFFFPPANLKLSPPLSPFLDFFFFLPTFPLFYFSFLTWLGYVSFFFFFFPLWLASDNENAPSLLFPFRPVHALVSSFRSSLFNAGHPRSVSFLPGRRTRRENGGLSLFFPPFFCSVSGRNGSSASPSLSEQVGTAFFSSAAGQFGPLPLRRITRFFEIFPLPRLKVFFLLGISFFSFSSSLVGDGDEGVVFRTIFLS